MGVKISYKSLAAGIAVCSLLAGVNANAAANINPFSAVASSGTSDMVAYGTEGGIDNYPLEESFPEVKPARPRINTSELPYANQSGMMVYGSAPGSDNYPFDKKFPKVKLPAPVQLISSIPGQLNNLSMANKTGLLAKAGVDTNALETALVASNLWDSYKKGTISSGSLEKALASSGQLDAYKNGIASGVISTVASSDMATKILGAATSSKGQSIGSLASTGKSLISGGYVGSQQAGKAASMATKILGGTGSQGQSAGAVASAAAKLINGEIGINDVLKTSSAISKVIGGSSTSVLTNLSGLTGKLAAVKGAGGGLISSVLGSSKSAGSSIANNAAGKLATMEKYANFVKAPTAPSSGGGFGNLLNGQVSFAGFTVNGGIGAGGLNGSLSGNGLNGAFNGGLGGIGGNIGGFGQSAVGGYGAGTFTGSTSSSNPFSTISKISKLF